ncbi:Dabb family protein [Parahaliea sp. F7430]|uniref:Dabb family protein n=1 Tax=Sediminihaliea albiluteola TaxID=2758564 RepID=A0A7W2TUZ3_9GAMM|nr:Dabb family protein [Sediminihaliea albiluteola]MBA6412363.1 Dabb family protein [Sediminihaliea albiluteola]
MIKHVALIYFKEGTSQERREAVKAAFESLPEHISVIREFSVGLDLNLLEGNADLAVFGTFDSEEDFLHYSTHAAHTDVIFPVCGEVMASYSTAQIKTG